MTSQSQIKIVVCTECGKPCRTDAEKDMHTRFTGHASYVDKVRYIHDDDTEHMNGRTLRGLGDLMVFPDR